MKIFSVFVFFAICLSQPYTAHAYDAIVIVLEAPLLAAPKLNSTVLQTLRKGSLVYVPTEIGNLLNSDAPMPDFVQTYDRAGNTAYIPTQFIKIITKEVSENKMPISFPGYDPTDYRLEEPIPLTYPYTDQSFLRIGMAISLGNNLDTPYAYNSDFSTQSLASDLGAKLTVTRKMSFDNYDRYYFGLVTAFSMSTNSIDFKNTNFSKETLSLLKAGPIITFDAYKTENFRFTAGTGFTYNYHQNIVTMSDSSGNTERRKFSGYSMSPFSSIILQFNELFPRADLITGADINFFLPHTQKTTDEIVTPALWRSTSPDSIDSGPKYQVAFFIGFQLKY